MLGYIELTSGGQTRRYCTNMRDTSGESHVFIRKNGVVGLMTPGENRSSPIDRTYSDGFVFNPRPTYSGKDISVNLIFHGNHSEVDNAYDNLINFLRLGNFTMTTNKGHNYTVQFQRVDIEEEEYGRTKATKSVMVYLTTKEAW